MSAALKLIYVLTLAVGLFFLASLGLVITLGWAVLTTMDRMAGTLTVLGYSPAIAAWALFGLFATAAVLHLACVLNAGSDTASLPNPVVTGIASLVKASTIRKSKP